MFPPTDPTQQKKRPGVPGAMTNGGMAPPVDTAPPMMNNRAGGGNPAATTNGGFTPPPVAPGMPTGGFLPGGRGGTQTDRPPMATTNAGGAMTNAAPAPAVDTAPGTTNMRVAGAPAAPVAPAFAPGFEDAGNGMARNPTTGQMLPVNHPAYQALMARAPTDTPPPSDGGPVAPPGAPPAAPGQVPMPMTAGDVTGTQAGSPQGPPTSIAQSFQQALISKLNPGAANADDPAIKGSIQANRLAEQRGAEQQRAQLAEQSAADGTNMSGGNAGMQRGILADSAMRQGQYAGDKVQHLSDQNNQSMLAALGLGGDFLQQNASRDQQGGQFNRTMDEQRRQADQDAELRRLGITTQGSLGQGDLALRGRLGEGGLNNQLLGLLLNDRQFGRQLGQQNSQFGQSLGQSGILGLLGML